METRFLQETWFLVTQERFWDRLLAGRQRMELKELKTFCVVVEKGSFSRAGEVVHLAQPTVSLQVKGLEDELGIKLLDRLDRKILPTPSGRILYHHAKVVLTKIEELKAELTESAGQKVISRQSPVNWNQGCW